MPENIGNGAESASAFALGEILGSVKAIQKNQDQARVDSKEQRDEVVRRLDSIETDIDKRMSALDIRVNAVEKFTIRLSTIAMIMSAAIPLATGLVLYFITGSH